MLDFIHLSATGVPEIAELTSLKGCPHTFVYIVLQCIHHIHSCHFNSILNPFPHVAYFLYGVDVFVQGSAILGSYCKPLQSITPMFIGHISPHKIRLSLSAPWRRHQFPPSHISLSDGPGAFHWPPHKQLTVQLSHVIFYNPFSDFYRPHEVILVSRSWQTQTTVISAALQKVSWETSSLEFRDRCLSQASSSWGTITHLQLPVLLACSQLLSVRPVETGPDVQTGAEDGQTGEYIRNGMWGSCEANLTIHRVTVILICKWIHFNIPQWHHSIQLAKCLWNL